MSLYDIIYKYINILPVISNVRRSSQTGKSIGDRPAFWDFGSGSGYNFLK